MLYISLYNCVNFPSGPSSNAFSISAAIKSVPVALLVFNFLMACFTSVDVIEGPLSSSKIAPSSYGRLAVTYGLFKNCSEMLFWIVTRNEVCREGNNFAMTGH